MDIKYISVYCYGLFGCLLLTGQCGYVGLLQGAEGLEYQGLVPAVVHGTTQNSTRSCLNAITFIGSPCALSEFRVVAWRACL